MRKIDPVLGERLEKLISSMGFELVGCEMLPQGGRKLFRIYIDTKDGAEKVGVTVEDCSKVSRQVSAMFDVEDLFQNQYTLEVSSPGINRPLFELKHFQKYIGSHVQIKLGLPINQRRQFKGVLKRVENENIYLLVDELQVEVVMPFSTIEKANLIGEIHF